MVTRKNAIQLISKSFTLFMLAALLFAWGCQKSSKEEFPEETITTGSASPENLTVEEATLQMVYGFRPGELGAAEAEDLYNQLTSNLTHEQFNQMEGLLRQYQDQASVSEGLGGVNFRSMNETIVSAGIPDDDFGSGIAKVGNTLFVGAPGVGEVKVYEGTSLSQTLTPSNGAAGFGSIVAASGQWLAVAAYGEVIMFQKQGGSYVEEAIINPGLLIAAAGGSGADIAMDANKLAISGRDGVTAVIKVYKLQQGNWVSDGDIDLTDEDIFLWDIDMHANRIAANGGTNAGLGILFSPQVYVFKNTGNVWSLNAQTALPAGYQLTRAVAIDNSTVVANTAFFNFTSSNKTAVYSYSSGNLSLSDELEQPGPMSFVQTR